MDVSKKLFTYIKNGKVLREQEGLIAKAEHDANELFKEITGDLKSVKNDEISQLLIEIVNAFRKGPLSSKPKEELHSSTSSSSGNPKDQGVAGDEYEGGVSGAASVLHKTEGKVKSSPDNFCKYSKGISKVGASAESDAKVNFQIGKEVAEVEYEASVSGAASVSYTKEQKTESSPDNSLKYSHSILKVEASADSAGKAEFRIRETEVAKAEYKANVSAAASVSYTKEKKHESSPDNSYKYSSTSSKVETSGEFKGESDGKVTVGRGKNKVGANYSGGVNLQVNAGVSLTEMQKESRRKNSDITGSVKVAEAKVEAQAKTEMHGKVGIGGSKKKEIDANLQAKATTKAEVVGLHGKADLTVRKKEKMGFHVPGAEIKCGKGQAEATAEFDLKSNKFGDKKGKAKAEVKVEGVRARALGVNVQAEEECTKAEADLGIRMMDIKAGNAKVAGRKKGLDVEAEAKGKLLELNALNAVVTGVDNIKKAKAEAKGGMFANVGNVQVTGLGSKGAYCKVDTRAGVSVGNIAVGIKRETGIEVTNRQLAYGNVNLQLGAPSFSLSNIGGNFNIGIPFLSAGGSSGGGNDGTSEKQTGSQNVAGKQSGDSTGCGYQSVVGENNTTSKDGNVKNGGCYTEPNAGMDLDASQRGNYDGNTDYVRRSGSNTEPQTVIDEQFGDAYGNGTAIIKGVYSRDVQEEGLVEHGTDYTVDIGEGMIDRNASQECGYANTRGEYMGHSESYVGPQNPTGEHCGGACRYGTTGKEGIYSRNVQQEGVVNNKTGYTVDISADADYDSSQECDFVNSEYMNRSRSYAGPNSQIEQAQKLTQGGGGCTATGCGRGVDRDTAQSSFNGSFLHGDDNEFNGAGRSNYDHYGSRPSKDVAVDSEAKDLRVVQTVDRSLATRDDENCEFKNASPAHKNTHTDMERLMVLLQKKMTKKFGERPALRQRQNEAKSYQGGDSINKEQIKKYFTTKYTSASGSGSGETNRHSIVEETGGTMYSPEDENYSKPRTKVQPKKPFGEKNNIHTIFTLSEGDYRPIKHIKGNVFCFGEE